MEKPDVNDLMRKLTLLSGRGNLPEPTCAAPMKEPSLNDLLKQLAQLDRRINNAEILLAEKQRQRAALVVQIKAASNVEPPHPPLRQKKRKLAAG